MHPFTINWTITNYAIQLLSSFAVSFKVMSKGDLPLGLETAQDKAVRPQLSAMLGSALASSKSFKVARRTLTGLQNEQIWYIKESHYKQLLDQGGERATSGDLTCALNSLLED